MHRESSAPTSSHSPVEESTRRHNLRRGGASRVRSSRCGANGIGCGTYLRLPIESALALESAAVERDRLNLLLKINNHIVTHLDVNDLFRAASASIRKLINNAFTGFWLFEEGSTTLQCFTLDFSGSRGLFEAMPAPTFGK